MSISHQSIPTLAGAIVGATMTAFIMASTTTSRHTETGRIHSTTGTDEGATPVTAHAATYDDTDASLTAAREMHAHALADLGVFEDDPQSFGVSDTWSPDWRLSWIDVHHEGRTVRIYHATHVRHPERRYTSTAETDGNTHWRRTH